MTPIAQNILQSFKLLPEVDKREVAAEIFRLTLKFDYPPLTDDDLILNAEELFLELDRREAANA
jgi:hypothetical protein